MFKHVFYEVNKYLISTSDQYICETVMTWEWSIVTWAAELGIGNHGLGASASTKRHLCVICVMPLRPGGGHSLPFNKFSLKAISQFCLQPTRSSSYLHHYHYHHCHKHLMQMQINGWPWHLCTICKSIFKSFPTAFRMKYLNYILVHLGSCDRFSI